MNYIVYVNIVGKIINMSKLFDIVNGKVILSPATLYIPEFKKLWDRDGSEEHDTAIAEISYVVFMYDHKSPYRDIKETDKEPMIRKDCGFKAKWKPDAAIVKAVDKYKILQETASSRLLQAAKVGADKLTEYFETAESYDANNIVKNLKELGNVVRSIDTLQKQVEREQLEKNSARGDREIGYFERYEGE